MKGEGNFEKNKRNRHKYHSKIDIHKNCIQIGQWKSVYSRGAKVRGVLREKKLQMNFHGKFHSNRRMGECLK